MAQNGDIRIVFDGDTDVSGLVWMDTGHDVFRHIRLEQYRGHYEESAGRQEGDWVPVVFTHERCT